MTKLPRVSGRECIGVLTRAGFRVRRQQSSHIILRRDDPFAQLVVPDHKELDRVPDHKELDRGTLRAILRQAGISIDEFVKLL